MSDSIILSVSFIRSTLVFMRYKISSSIPLSNCMSWILLRSVRNAGYGKPSNKSLYPLLPHENFSRSLFCKVELFHLNPCVLLRDRAANWFSLNAFKTTIASIQIKLNYAYVYLNFLQIFASPSSSSWWCWCWSVTKYCWHSCLL